MNSRISLFNASKSDTIAGLLDLLAHYGVKVYLRDGKLKVRKPWPSWEDAPSPVRYALRWLKARRQELEVYLQEQAKRELLDTFYSWTLPVTDEKESRVKQAFEQGNGTPAVPVPERKRSTWFDRWPPLPDLLARLEAAGFRLELDGESLRVIPPALAEELPPEVLELYNQATARAKAIALHLRGKEHQENIRQRCWSYLPEGADPMDYQFDPATGRWEHRPGWWRKEALH